MRRIGRMGGCGVDWLSRCRDGFVLIGFLAPEGELLSFASPKESNQRKGDPVAALILRSSLSTGVARRAIPGPLATRCIHAAPLTG